MWLLNDLPEYGIVELPSRDLYRFRLEPYRTLEPERDFTPYTGQHPRKISGTPLPDTMYRLYGLSRSNEAMTEMLRIRVTPSEQKALQAAAKKERVTVSELIREYIASLL